jgi:hypothetical protein
MMREGLSFQGIFFNKKESRDSQNRCVVSLTIKHSDKSGGVQSFLDSFSEKTGIMVTQAFAEPVNWNKINFKITANLVFSVEFDEMEFEARLSAINVARKYSKKDEVDVYEYNLVFDKPTSEDNFDIAFSETYLKYTEEDADGKKSLAEFPVSLKLIEKEYESLDDENISDVEEIY